MAPLRLVLQGREPFAQRDQRLLGRGRVRLGQAGLSSTLKQALEVEGRAGEVRDPVGQGGRAERPGRSPGQRLTGVSQRSFARFTRLVAVSEEARQAPSGGGGEAVRDRCLAETLLPERWSLGDLQREGWGQLAFFDPSLESCLEPPQELKSPAQPAPRAAQCGLDLGGALALVEEVADRPPLLQGADASSRGVED